MVVSRIFSGGGAKHCKILVSPTTTCKTNSVDSQTYVLDILTRIVDCHSESRLDELLPFAYVKSAPASELAPVSLDTTLFNGTEKERGS